MTITVDEMKRLDEDLDRRVAEGTFAEGRGRKNAYTCSSCGRLMCTVNRNPGTTPMFKGCAYCDGEARSHGYRVPRSAPPFFEWYRPMTEQEIAGVLAVDDGHGSYSEYIKMGGLAFRRIPEDRLPRETAEYLQFSGPEKLDLLDFDDAVHAEAERMVGMGVPRSGLVLEIDAEIRNVMARTQSTRDRVRVMDTWQGMDLVELRENRGGQWNLRRKA